MTGDVPGRKLVPDPSLGGAPLGEGPTTHRLGESRPAVCAIQPLKRLVADAGEYVQLAKAQGRSRGCRELLPGI